MSCKESCEHLGDNGHPASSECLGCDRYEDDLGDYGLEECGRCGKLLHRHKLWMDLEYLYICEGCANRYDRVTRQS